MSKHWDPRIVQPYRRRHGWPVAPSLYRRRRKRFGVSRGELRLTILLGLMGGLAYATFSPESVPTRAERTPLLGVETVQGSRAAVVIDGDTFHYGGSKIRIADIDTPEVRGRCPYETALAARATRRLADLLAAGPFELQPIDRDEDRYGRKLRIVTRNGRSLGDQLVAEGLARTWPGRREPWCA